MKFKKFANNLIIKSKLKENDKNALVEYGFPISGYRAVIRDYYEPYSTNFPELKFKNQQFVGIAFDKDAKIHLAIEADSGCVIFVDDEYLVIDLLNTSYGNFIRSILLCDTFFNENPEFLSDVIKLTKENKGKMDHFKKKLISIDNEIWSDENNGWNVFVEELYYSLE